MYNYDWKPTQHCKAIIFQFKNKIKKRNKNDLYQKRNLKKKEGTNAKWHCFTWLAFRLFEQEFLSWSQSVFYCWSKFIAQGVNIPKLKSVPLALFFSQWGRQTPCIGCFIQIRQWWEEPETPGMWLLGPIGSCTSAMAETEQGMKCQGTVGAESIQGHMRHEHLNRQKPNRKQMSTFKI